MTTLIVTLARSVQGLTSVLKLLFFLILVFGTVFVELFSGSFRGRCFVDPSQNLTTAAKSRLESQQVSPIPRIFVAILQSSEQYYTYITSSEECSSVSETYVSCLYEDSTTSIALSLCKAMINTTHSFRRIFLFCRLQLTCVGLMDSIPTW